MENLPNHAALWFASVRWNDSHTSMISVLTNTICAKPKEAPRQKRATSVTIPSANIGSCPHTVR